MNYSESWGELPAEGGTRENTKRFLLHVGQTASARVKGGQGRSCLIHHSVYVMQNAGWMVHEVVGQLIGCSLWRSDILSSHPWIPLSLHSSKCRLEWHARWLFSVAVPCPSTNVQLFDVGSRCLVTWLWHCTSSEPHLALSWYGCNSDVLVGPCAVLCQLCQEGGAKCSFELFWVPA